MSIDPREALNQLMAALEQHFDVAQNAELVSEAALESVEERLQDAFFSYDDALFTNFGVELPFEMLDDELDADDDYESDEYDDILFEGEDEEHDASSDGN